MNLAEKLIQWLVKYFSSLNICFFLAASSSCDISIIGYFSFSLTLEGHSIQLHNIQLYKFASMLVFWFSFLITAFSFQKKNQEYVSAELRKRLTGRKLKVPILSL